MRGGHESIDANLHLQRPSFFETDRCTGTTWKENFRAVIQLAPGHPTGVFLPPYTMPVASSRSCQRHPCKPSLQGSDLVVVVLLRKLVVCC